MDSPSSRAPTRALSTSTNTIVLLRGAPKMSLALRDAALRASGASVVECAIHELATRAAELRPYALVIPREIYEFGGDEFDALARDVDAGLLVVGENAQPSVLAASLAEEAQRLG